MKFAFNLPGVYTTEKLEDKLQFRYLTSYLFSDQDGLKVRTMIIENEYSSIPYMADYINYYAHCYADYPKTCRRIHFFKTPITEGEFEDMVINNAHEGNWKRYAGYIVVKPLPAGFIGATVLEPYSQKVDRWFNATKDYPINLFGKSLKINTLQYQEQDGIVGSCASAAAGFAFQKTSELFGTSMPSPSEITLLAGSDSHFSGKVFPNKEMTVEQICRAITATGLIAEIIDRPEYLNDDTWFNACAYAYLKSGIPLLLGMDVEKNRRSHLITLTGYRFGKRTPIVKLHGKLKLDMLSDNIVKFYAHDDQLGPFTRLEVIEDPARKQHFRTSYWKAKNDTKYLKADPVTLLVPLKPSIKVFFDNIADEAVVLSTLLKRPDMEIPYVWDIFLIKSNEYKKEIRERLATPETSGIAAQDVLFKSLPQYIWIIRAYYRDKATDHLLFDILYDAIDVNFQGNPYFANIFNESYLDMLTGTGIINELSVFRRYHISGEPSSELFTIMSENTSVLEFLEDVEYEVEKGENPATQQDIVDELNKHHNKDFEKEIKDQKTSISSQIEEERANESPGS